MSLAEKACLLAFLEEQCMLLDGFASRPVAQGPLKQCMGDPMLAQLPYHPYWHGPALNRVLGCTAFSGSTSLPSLLALRLADWWRAATLPQVRLPQAAELRLPAE